MDAKHPTPTDAVAIIRQLNADAIIQQLDALDAERQALLVLLRAAQRARRQERPRASEAAHA